MEYIVEGEWSLAKDMIKWFAYLINDIIGEIIFNRKWNMMEDEKYRDILELLPIGILGINIVRRTPASCCFGYAKI